MVGNGGRVLDELDGGAGGPGPAVDGDEVRPRRQGEFEVGLDVAGGELDARWDGRRRAPAARRPCAAGPPAWRCRGSATG
ncbi:MAG: hypothetical protein MZV64_50025 [Ignavibacteriales bacterium]|nr:hypothetical protein [Ignavibacteriales bacterium]